MFTMKVLPFTSMFFVLLKFTSGELPLCKNGVETIEFCQVTEKYPITPLVVKPWLEINKIMGVHEDAKSIKVNFHLMLRWNDIGIAVMTPENKT